ncbi:MAG: cupin domain-containing protein [Vicinamibacterales bacterium]
MGSRRSHAFDLSDLVSAHGDGHWAEFLNVETLRAGIYRLPVDAIDPQQPHAEDEVYYVIEGRAVLRVEAETMPVGPGSIVFVPAGMPHRFEQIDRDLLVLVFFFSGTPPP